MSNQKKSWFIIMENVFIDLGNIGITVAGIFLVKGTRAKDDPNYVDYEDDDSISLN